MGIIDPGFPVRRLLFHLLAAVERWPSEEIQIDTAGVSFKEKKAALPPARRAPLAENGLRRLRCLSSGLVPSSRRKRGAGA